MENLAQNSFLRNAAAEEASKFMLRVSAGISRLPKARLTIPLTNPWGGDQETLGAR